MATSTAATPAARSTLDRAAAGALLGALAAGGWLALGLFTWMRYHGRRAYATLPTLLDFGSVLGAAVVTGAACAALQPTARTPIRGIAIGAGAGALFCVLRQSTVAWLSGDATAVLLESIRFFLPLNVTLGALVGILFLYYDAAGEDGTPAAQAADVTTADPVRLNDATVTRTKWLFLVLLAGLAYGCTTSIRWYAMVGIGVLAVGALFASPPVPERVDVWVSPDTLRITDWWRTTEVPLRQVTTVVALPNGPPGEGATTPPPPPSAAVLRLEYATGHGARTRSVYVDVPAVPDQLPMAHADAWVNLLLHWRDRALTASTAETAPPAPG